MLQRELPSPTVSIVRSGVDGQLARNIEARAAAAIAAAASAQAPLSGVVLFAGTNDALSMSNGQWRTFHARVTKFLKGPDEEVSADTYEASVRRTVEAAVAATAGAGAKAGGGGVALVTLPPLDEHDLENGPGNAVVRELNARLRKVAAEFFARGGVTLIDFFAACERDLAQHPPPPRAPSSAAPAPPPPPPHTPLGTLSLEIGGLARRWLLRQDLDAIAAANGGRLLTDRIHLSDAAGRLLCDALLPWARGVAGGGGERGGE